MRTSCRGGQHGQRTDLGSDQMNLPGTSRPRKIDSRQDRPSRELRLPLRVGCAVARHIESQDAQLAVGEEVGQRPPRIQVLSLTVDENHPALARAEDQASQYLVGGAAELDREHPRERC